MTKYPFSDTLHSLNGREAPILPAGEPRARPYHRPTSYVLFPLIIIAILWGWAFWKWPLKTFALLPFILPSYLVRTTIGPLPTTLLELIVIATVIVWILKKVGSRESGVGITQFLKDTWNRSRFSLLSSRFFLPILAWLIAGFVSIFIAENHIAALGLYRAYFIEPVLIFIIGSDLMNNNQNHAPRPTSHVPILSSLLASRFSLLLIILGLYAAVQYATGWGIPYPWHDIAGRRAVGPFPYPNALSLFVAPIVVLAFADQLRPKAERMLAAWLGWGAVIGGLIAVGLAKSDGGFIAICAGMFIASLFHKRIRMIAISISVIAVIAIAVIAPLKHKVLNVVTFKEWSGMVRTVMWKESVTMLKDHPIFGAGLGGYPDAIKPYHKATWMEIFQYPHNIALNLWSETGLLGLVAFGWILWNWAYGLRLTAYGKKVAVSHWPLAVSLPVIATLLVHGLVDVPYFKNDLAIMFWLLILMTTIKPSIEKT
jgi:O-antigen ligase